ncbi:hypothetical protein ACJJTC_013847 [Scirpophaga incertulas]
MYRAITLVVAVVCLNFTAKASPQPISRDFLTSLLSVDANEDGAMSTEYQPFGDLGVVISAIKNQFREILREVLYQMVDYFVSVLRHLKLKLIRKLGTYTLADILNFTCDFVTDMLLTPVPQVQPVPFAPSKNNVVLPYDNDAALFSSLQSLLNAGDDK